MGVQICVDNYYEKGSILPDFDIFFYAFSKFDKVYPAVLAMYLLSFSVVPLIYLVKNYKLSRFIYIPVYGIIQLLIIAIALGDCAYFSLPPASAMIVSVEMARLSMKVHAYFREKTMNGIFKDGDIALFIPEWAKR
jgi:hypothetical protein